MAQVFGGRWRDFSLDQPCILNHCGNGIGQCTVITRLTRLTRTGRVRLEGVSHS